jgi:hypothetical protein
MLTLLNQSVLSATSLVTPETEMFTSRWPGSARSVRQPAAPSSVTSTGSPLKARDFSRAPPMAVPPSEQSLRP